MMAYYGSHPSINNADDPSDPVWRWFILNGPHGEKFRWDREIPGFKKSLELLVEFIEERSTSIPDFKDRARLIALRAITMEDPTCVRKGIQVLTILGTDEDIEMIRNFLSHLDEDVKKDAKCCLFERKRK